MTALDPSAFDPPAEIEGPDNGLIEALADRIWSYRARYYAKHRLDFTRQSKEVRNDWRETAKDALTFMFGLGFQGPAGRPDQDRFERLTYAWLYSGATWEILDEAGGYVALVNDNSDMELMLAAPGMRSAIKALLAAIPVGHPARAMPELQALEASLPESRA